MHVFNKFDTAAIAARAMVPFGGDYVLAWEGAFGGARQRLLQPTQPSAEFFAVERLSSSARAPIGASGAKPPRE